MKHRPTFCFIDLSHLPAIYLVFIWAKKNVEDQADTAFSNRSWWAKFLNKTRTTKTHPIQQNRMFLWLPRNTILWTPLFFFFLWRIVVQKVGRFTFSVLDGNSTCWSPSRLLRPLLVIQSRSKQKKVDPNEADKLRRSQILREVFCLKIKGFFVVSFLGEAFLLKIPWMKLRSILLKLRFSLWKLFDPKRPNISWDLVSVGGPSNYQSSAGVWMSRGKMCFFCRDNNK